MLGHFFKKGIKLVIVNKKTNELIIKYILQKSLKESVIWYRRSAENGYPEGQYYFGTCFEEGIGVSMNFNQAIQWYKLSGENGFGIASYHLGKCYKRGYGVPMDTSKAKYWIEKSAKQNFDKGQYLLGWYYESEEKMDKAIYWYEKAANLNNLDAMNNLGRCYLDGNEETEKYEKGIKWLTIAAEKGHGNAQNNLGWWIKDPNKSFYWFLKAACQGFSCSQNNVAWCYQEGCGVEKNEHLAVKWYKKAISKHNLFSKTHMGWCYQNGIGVKRNEKLAFKWYKGAACENHIPAKEILGWCYWYGIGTSINYKKSIKIFSSIDVKHDYELPNMDTILEMEASYLNNKDERFKNKKDWWFGKEAETKVKSSDMYILGMQKKLGINGIKKNLEEAFKWFVLSASLGFELAQFEVGICYKDGIGIQKNLYKSKQWFEKSYERKIYEAGKILKFFYLNRKKNFSFGIYILNLSYIKIYI
ncbi:HCP-like protein [Anaeromyces robustus]|uniref:HCP-like protein n=1 Tax=Anaeromyces robustus TaxID=1754192 RepID=A0A1Y1XKL7_9FUNG|nr:HCP-like protein [Anaeromyces robustus]|eukprot:ORX86298.1 HCP-like protein [Anaeromyces robustus]